MNRPTHCPLQIIYGVLPGALLTVLLLLTGCSSAGEPTAVRAIATSTPVAGAATQTIVAPLDTGTPDVAPPPSSAELSTLSTAAQIALAVVPQHSDLRDLALRLNPERDEIPIVVNATVPDYAVGETAPFWVHDLNANTNFQITAELIHKNDNVYAWVEQGKQHDAESIAASIDHFSTR